MSLIDLENPQSEVALGLYMNGREFEVGIPVHLLLQGFESTQLICVPPANLHELTI